MRKQLAALVAVLVAGLLVLSCGGSSMTPQTSGSASMVLFGTDAPACSVLSFQVTITGATLTPQSGGSAVSIISSSSPVTVDFASLMGFNTVLNLTSVPAGTYSAINFTLANPQLTVLEGTPPAPTPLAASLASSTVSVSIQPALTVSANTPTGLTMDFRLLKSLQTDSSGQITGVVDPVIRITPAVITSGKTLGEVDDLTGIVQSVSTTSTNSDFTGSFTLQVRQNRTFLVNVTSTTKFENVSGLSALSSGLLVEVEAKVDDQGNIIAKNVESEDETDSTTAAFSGPVLSVTRDSTGAATQFTMFVRHENPDVSATVPLHSTLTVNLSSSTVFRIAAFETDLSAFLFNPASLAPGQRIVAKGQFTGGTSPSVAATLVALRPQSIMGDFQTLLAQQSDGVTGGFTLIPCNPVFQGQAVDVLTYSFTNFKGVTNLAGLTTTGTYIVRGYLLYATSLGSLNGVTWTPPAYVFAAGVVRQLNP